MAVQEKEDFAAYTQEEAQTIIHLRDNEKLGFKEIAKRLGRKRTSVAAKYHNDKLPPMERGKQKNSVSFNYFQPRQLLTDRQIRAIYAGRRYTSLKMKKNSKPLYMPHN